MSEDNAPILNYPESERTIIGTALVSTGTAKQIKSIIKPEDFYSQEGRKIFEVIEFILEKGSEVSILSVHNEFKRRGAGKDFSLDYLRNYLQYEIGNDDIATQVRQVTEAAGIRELAMFYESESNRFKNGNYEELEYNIQKLAAMYQNLATRGVTETSLTGDVLEQSLYDLLDKEFYSYPLLGIPEIDDEIVDFSGQEMLVFAARPGMGKTTALMQSALAQNPSADSRVGIISMEMNAPKLLIRALAQVTSTDSRQIRQIRTAVFRQSPKLEQALQNLKEGVIIDSATPYNLSNIRRKIYTMVHKQKAKIVYLDYIGLVEPDSNKSNRQEAVSEISRQIKKLSMELDIPIVIASQLNRGVENRVSNRPILSDLRESGAIEQDASVVMFIYPNLDKLNAGGDRAPMTNADLDIYLKNNLEIPTIIEIAKQRNGPVFTVEVIFQKQYNRFILPSSKNKTYGETPFGNDMGEDGDELPDAKWN